MLRLKLKYIIPIGIFIGAGVEFFMIKTGFYDIVVRKETERQLLRFEEEQELRSRLEKLNVKIAPSDSQGGKD